MRPLIIALVLLLGNAVQAQRLFGTFLGRYYREHANEKRLFYYRLYLQQAGDSTFGICEAFDAKADLNNLSIEGLQPVAAYRIYSADFEDASDSTVFNLKVGELIWIDGPLNPVDLPPAFFDVKCYPDETPSAAGFKPAIFNSLLPVNDAGFGEMQVTKLSDSLPDLSFYNLDNTGNLSLGRGVNKRVLLPFRTKRKVKEHTGQAQPKPVLSYTERQHEIQKVMEVNAPVVTIQLFDNGMVDNDTVSLYFNDKLVLHEQRLTGSPVSLELQLEPAKENKLSLYAHNLGDIAPNTAYMLVKWGAQQYPVHLSGSLEKNAVVVLRLLPE